MAVNVFRSTARAGGSLVDTWAVALLGFVLGLCVNGAVPQLDWLLWIANAPK